MNDLVEFGGAQPPTLRTFEGLDTAWAELDAARTAVVTAYEPTAELLAQIDRALEVSQRHGAEIADALKPIPRGVLALHTSMLVNAYPGSAQQDVKIYGRLLREDVLSLDPSVGAVDVACRRWRRRSKFPPAISELMDEVRSAQSQIDGAAEFVKRLPALRAEYAARLNSL